MLFVLLQKGLFCFLKVLAFFSPIVLFLKQQHLCFQIDFQVAVWPKIPQESCGVHLASSLHNIIKWHCPKEKKLRSERQGFTEELGSGSSLFRTYWYQNVTEDYHLLVFWRITQNTVAVSIPSEQMDVSVS